MKTTLQWPRLIADHTFTGLALGQPTFPTPTQQAGFSNLTAQQRSEKE
jgi:hypothetical protein